MAYMLLTSPLVSWHAGTRNVECGRQLFLLTPLTKSRACLSTGPGPSKSVVGIITDKEQSSCCRLPPLSASDNSALDYLLGQAEQAPSNISKAFLLRK